MQKTTRKFILHTFRELGQGNAKLEEYIISEAKKLAGLFAAKNGQLFDPFRLIHSGVSNVVRRLCLGERSESTDPELIKKLVDLESATEAMAQLAIFQAYPILRHVPGSLKNHWKSIAEPIDWNKKLLQDSIREHRRTYQENETRDYIDSFLHKQNTLKASAAVEEQAFRGQCLLFVKVTFHISHAHIKMDETFISRR
jgi:hypothetical protein